MNPEKHLRETYDRIAGFLSEQNRRLWAASEAISLGYGGVSVVNKATGLSRQTIHTGIKELNDGIIPKNSERIRREGGGRNKVEETDKSVLSALLELVKDHTRGDPMQALFWTSKSTENLASELEKMGYIISDRTVARLLHDLDYSLQSNRKSLEGKQSEERNSQFEYINKMVREFQEKKQPVISVDTKKKELVGNHKNNGQEWHLKGKPTNVKVHDFENKKAIPYGIYDLTWNTGWVNVGVDHDTAEFAVASIRNWWKKMGQASYPSAKQLLINADGGGSNSSRVKLWKFQLQELADETRLEITVCHLPPGTSKWNKIEHRLFCHITQNWRARPLTSYEVIVNLIGSTTTKTGLKVRSELDEGEYPLAKEVSDDDMGKIKIRKHELNSKWNYTISPR
jgi:transposase